MSIHETNPAGAKDLLDGDEGWTLVDVRSPQEFAAGHIPGAYNLPIAFRGPMGMEFNESFVSAARECFEKDSRLVLICAAGVRSRKAAEFLEAEGYSRLANMNGGMSGGFNATGSAPEAGWMDQGFEVTSEPVEGRTWEALSARVG